MSDEYLWLQYEPFDRVKGGNPGLVRPDARVNDLFYVVALRLQRAFRGRRWLGQRFGPATDLALLTRLTEEPTVVVGDIAEGSLRGCPAILCDLRVPADWFRGPVDGLVGLRLLQAATVGIAAVGREFSLGDIPIRSPGQDRRKDDITLFQAAPALVAAQREAADAFDQLPPGHGILCGSVTTTDERWVSAVVAALGGSRLPSRHESEVRLWRVPTTG